MWCSFLGYDCTFSIECQNCPIWKQNNTGYWRISEVQQYNYKCPDCHGEFSNPSCGMSGTSAFLYRCPFCGRGMEGL